VARSYASARSYVLRFAEAGGHAGKVVLVAGDAG
jgi:hypothetical protein